MRVDGAAPRGFLRFLSLTALRAEGCGGGFAASFKDFIQTGAFYQLKGAILQPSAAKPLSNFRTFGAIAPSNFRTFKSHRGLSLKRLYGFRRQRRHKKWRRRRRTSPADTVSQPIGKPFNGQAKGLLWLTWRSYAGPPQYFIPPEGGALNPSGRRQPVPDRTLGAQVQRPGGAINPRPRKRASTFGNTGKHRPGLSPGPDPDRATGLLSPIPGPHPMSSSP